MKKILTEMMREKRKKLILPLLNKEWKILDVACGSGWLTNYLNEKGYNCIGADRDINDSNKRLIKAEATKLPFADHNFDCVISISTLEHVQCEEELKRVLKPDGLLIAECPNIPDFPLKILFNLGLIQGDIDEHIRLVNFKKLPFKLIKKKLLGLGFLQFGIFRNEL